MKTKRTKRDMNFLLQARREIDMRTKTDSLKKPKYTRKMKHKNKSFDLNVLTICLNQGLSYFVRLLKFFCGRELFILHDRNKNEYGKMGFAHF